MLRIVKHCLIVDNAMQSPNIRQRELRLGLVCARGNVHANPPMRNRRSSPIRP